jgi:DNA-binding transcriptional MerR regulator
MTGDSGFQRAAADAGARPAVLRPGEAARAIGIQPSTLRVYAQRFAELLGDDAAGSGRSGYRVFGERDVAVLRQAKALLERGFTYQDAAARLRETQPSRPAGARRRERSDGGRTDPDLAGRLAILEQAVDAWRALAEERAAEVAALRAELRALHERLAAPARYPQSRLRTR